VNTLPLTGHPPLLARETTRSNESSAEPRVAVSNNDCTVKFFDVNMHGNCRWSAQAHQH